LAGHRASTDGAACLLADIFHRTAADLCAADAPDA
jgi:hypothetical protein